MTTTQVSPLFTTSPHPTKVNHAKYNFVNTSDLLCTMESMGWSPSKITVMRKRNPDNLPYAKHIAVLENKAFSNGEFAKQIIITNSHDGSTGIRFDIGLLRFICANGLVVGSTFGGVSFRHVGANLKQAVSQAVDEITGHFKTIETTYQVMLNRPMLMPEINEFTTKAYLIRYGAYTGLPVIPTGLDKVNRPEDSSNTLWHTYNRVQENLLKGNFKRNSVHTRTGLRKARAVKVLSESMRINKELGDLAM